MRVLTSLSLVFAVAVIAAAQSQEPPLSESRLTVHTLLREDIFAGFMAKDMARFERGERNIAQLMRDRPDQRGNLLAWTGTTKLHRAVLAHEAGNADEFKKYYEAALDAFAEAARQTSGNEGVPPITGGSFSVFADRLPEQYRAEAWQHAYAAYSLLWKQQGAMVDKLPVHHRGELLSGLAQSAQRTGRTEEVTTNLDRMLTHLKGTPYESTAQQWKADPASAAKSNLTCKNCHNPGRLTSQLAALKGQ
jgi:hypothetical protein